MMLAMTENNDDAKLTKVVVIRGSSRLGPHLSYAVTYRQLSTMAARSAGYSFGEISA